MERVAGKTTTITFDGKKCIHARYCVLTLPDVFQAGVKGQWIYPDNASAEDVAHLAKICPSGAIEFERNDGGENEANPMVNTARILENGPIAMNSELSVDGETVGTRAALCRCGQTRNKPFCDGSHAKAGFMATGEIAVIEAEPLTSRDGPVAVTPLEDGPLVIVGNLEILRGSGTRSTVTTKTALCRCGASANKPYCDGSHVASGFKSAGEPD